MCRVVCRKCSRKWTADAAEDAETGFGTGAGAVVGAKRLGIGRIVPWTMLGGLFVGVGRIEIRNRSIGRFIRFVSEQVGSAVGRQCHCYRNLCGQLFTFECRFGNIRWRSRQLVGDGAKKERRRNN